MKRKIFGRIVPLVMIIAIFFTVFLSACDGKNADDEVLSEGEQVSSGGSGDISAGDGESAEEDADDIELFEGAVCYSEFGAVGDGKTDDFYTIKATHDYANEKGLPVKADTDVTYYIAPHEKTVTVKTSTDWGNAKFIIDDKSAEQDSQEWWYPLFDVRADNAEYTMTLPHGYSLSAGQKNINLDFDRSVMLYIVNANKKDYIRYGNNQDEGDLRQEVILVDKDGNVDESTPIMWDYSEVTLMKVYSVEEKSIMLKGGEFTTIANDDAKIMHYFNRAIDVKRANTVVKGVKHYVTEEGDTGSPYNGFFRANFTNNVTFSNCVMTGHKIYKNERGVDQGTYDTRLNCCNDIKYINCVQSQDISDTKYWGIMCSDYCKNILMESCELSRFDAHKGVYNATIRNCVLGQNVSVIGGGTLLMENTVRIVPEGSTGCNRFLTLRYDYGSRWDGDIVIKDCTLKTYTGLNYLIDAHWYDWDFGFACKFPESVTVDNVKVEYVNEVNYTRNYIFGFITEIEGQTPGYMKTSINPVSMTKKIYVKNEQTVFEKTANKLGWFAETEVEYIE